MALLFDARFRALDASGNPYAGALLTVYDANTTTLSATKTSSTLVTPLTNPVVADSAGRFPQIFLAEATTTDLILKTSAGVTVATYEDVIALGSDTGAFYRDLTGSRFTIRNVGGVVYAEFGNATGDDVGGSGRLGGWLGTQMDDLTLDAAMVNAGTSSGALKENSKKLASVVYTEATTFTAVASVDIVLPSSPTGVRGYEIDIWDFSLAGNSVITFRTSHDGGGSYKSGATDYDWMYTTSLTATGVSVSGHTTAAQAQISTSLTGSGNALCRITLEVITPSSGNAATHVRWRASGPAFSGEYVEYHGFAEVGATYGRVDRIRLASTNNMTGKYLVRPLRGYGEA